VGFLEIYATTILEGLILSFLLFILSFIAIIILQMRDRRNPALWRGPSNP
jgi:prolipoprotein diacylglyceryltransferase